MSSKASPEARDPGRLTTATSAANPAGCLGCHHPCPVPAADLTVYELPSFAAVGTLGITPPGSPGGTDCQGPVYAGTVRWSQLEHPAAAFFRAVPAGWREPAPLQGGACGPANPPAVWPAPPDTTPQPLAVRFRRPVSAAQNGTTQLRIGAGPWADLASCSVCDPFTGRPITTRFNVAGLADQWMDTDAAFFGTRFSVGEHLPLKFAGPDDWLTSDPDRPGRLPRRVPVRITGPCPPGAVAGQTQHWSLVLPETTCAPNPQLLQSRFEAALSAAPVDGFAYLAAGLCSPDPVNDPHYCLYRGFLRVPFSITWEEQRKALLGIPPTHVCAGSLVADGGTVEWEALVMVQAVRQNLIWSADPCVSAVQVAGNACGDGSRVRMSNALAHRSRDGHSYGTFLIPPGGDAMPFTFPGQGNEHPVLPIEFAVAFTGFNDQGPGGPLGVMTRSLPTTDPARPGPATTDPAPCRHRSEDAHTLKDGTGRLAFTCQKPGFQRLGLAVLACDTCGDPARRCGPACPGYAGG
jgi:hypothetical protein